MSTSKRKVLLNTVSVNLGCSCRKPKLFSSFFNPKPKSSKTPKYQKYHNNYSYSSSTTSSTNTSWDKTSRNFSSSSPYECYYPTINSTTYSPFMDTTTSSSSSSSQPPTTVDVFGRVQPKSVAVEKDSNDPYLDFRQSMLQMIMENQIYSKDDLKELLNCFLQLNSPSLHGTIIRVFTEIWNSFFFNNGRPDHSSPRFFVRPKSYEI